MKASNTLTLFRLACIIPLLYLLFSDLPFTKTGAFILFVILLLTDYLDGIFARENNQVSDFGVLFNPLADKIVIISVFVAFVALQKISPWVVIVIISREFVITCFDLLLANRNKPIKFTEGGNYKSISQIVVAVLILFVNAVKEMVLLTQRDIDPRFEVFASASINILAWIAMIFAVISGYFSW